MLVQLGGASPQENVEDLSVGERDQLLIQAFRSCFGDDIEVFSCCSVCSCELEVHVDLRSLSVPEYKADDRAEFEVLGKCLNVEAIRIRDLKQLKSVGIDNWIDRKLTRANIEIDLIDQSVRDKYVARISDLDPQADICLEFECIECGAVWIDPFDIASQLWIRFDAMCKRLLASIHSLASAYGWSEEQVLGLSPWRREVYLNMVRASA